MKQTKVSIGPYHPLCKALQSKGYSIRFSQDIVGIVFSGIKEALLRREDVYLPIGNLLVEKETRRKQRRIGLNGPEWVYSKPYKIVFEDK